MAHRCEDYPCCGHGPAPMGDGGGCPNEDGQFDCVLCGSLLPKGAHSAICADCRRHPPVGSRYSDDGEGGQWFGPDDYYDDDQQ